MTKYFTQFLSALIFFGVTWTAAAFAEDLTDNANYKARCKICHGADAEGKPAMKIPALKTRASKTEAELIKAIEEGNDTSKPKMPPFKEKADRRRYQGSGSRDQGVKVGKGFGRAHLRRAR